MNASVSHAQPVDGVIRSTKTAPLLEANGVKLAKDVSEAVIRPLSALPSADLQLAGGKLLQALGAPERRPTQPLASKVVRTIRNAIEP